MAPPRTTEALVLRTHDFGEADRVVVLLSADEGRVEGVLRGARRLRSGAGASLEMLSYVRAHYRERPGKELVSIARLELLESTFGLFNLPESLALGAHLVELAQAVGVPGDGHPKLVRLLRAIVAALRAHATGDDPTSVLALTRLYYDVWVAKLEGFWPHMDACQDCGEGLSGDRFVGVLDQGAVCRLCRGRHRTPMLRLGSEGSELEQRVVRVGPSAFVTLEVSGKAIDELSRVAAALLTVHLDRELRTMPAPDIVRIRHQ